MIAELLHPDDPSISFVFPGVRQDHLGRDYREGRDNNGLPVLIDARDPRVFKLSDGLFVRDTLHVIVVEPDGTTYRAGHAPGMPTRRMVGLNTFEYGPPEPKGEKKALLPTRFIARVRGGLSRFVG